MLRLLGFAKAVRDFIKDGVPAVTYHQYGERIAACEKCPHVRGVSCGLSNCRCWIWSKAISAKEVCPDKPPRWPAIQSTALPSSS
jgi:hypothetical protein